MPDRYDFHRDDSASDEECDDIKGELVASAREASMSFVPFGDLDLLALSHTVEDRKPRHLRAVR